MRSARARLAGPPRRLNACPPAHPLAIPRAPLPPSPRRMARTTARTVAGGARAGMTVAKPVFRAARVPGEGAAVGPAPVAPAPAPPAPAPPAAAGAGAPAGAAVPAPHTPGAAPPRSRLADLPPAKTPAMALMKSATLLPVAAGARTPGAVSAFLPKTPGPAGLGGAGAGAGGDAKRARVKRRNEMVYHVAVSENGSPILDPA